MKAVAHRLVLLVVHLQEEHIWVLLRKLTNLHEIDSSENPQSSQKFSDIGRISCNSEFGILFVPHLGVKSTAAATARGEKVDDDELVAGVGQGIDKVLGGLDLTHVGLQPLLPPPHRFPNRKIHVHLSNRSNKIISLVKIFTFLFYSWTKARESKILFLDGQTD